MYRFRKLALMAVAAGMLASALPVAAASGDVAWIALRDFNHDGRVDRAVVAVENPSHATWSVVDGSGFAVSYGGTELVVSDVFVASATSDPALIEVVLSEDDSRVPLTTSTDGFEVSYARVGLSGASAAGAELMAFAGDDATSALTEKDEAAPVLRSSVPVAGSFEVLRSSDLTLTFSEAVDAGSLQVSSVQNPGSWGFTPSADGTSYTVTHFQYRADVEERFGIAAKDLAGNALVLGSYPNPFSFRTTADTTPATQVDTVFAITSPLTFASLAAGQPALLSWYTNQTAVATIRLSYSTDGGQSYITIGTAPTAKGVYVWYPPKLTSSFHLRAEGLNLNGAILAATTVFPLNVTGDAAPLQVISGPTVTSPSASSALVTVRLDRTPASAALSCQGLSPVQATFSGDRPVRAEALLTGLTAGPTFACTFILTDANGAETRLAVPSVRPEPDVSGPVLIGPAVIDRFDLAARTAKLVWTTDEPSRAEVRYGIELDYSGQIDIATPALTHEVTLLNLTPGAMHQVRVTSLDSVGNAAVSRDYYFVFLREGDLIKGTGPAVYWYKGGKRYVFPHLDVYRSWFGDGFSKVIRVPDTQLGTIALGANMRMKEGVYLVKIQSDPKTYAVEPEGVLRWVQTEAHARQLYGDLWAKRVRDVDVSLFTDYVIGPPLEPGQTPAGYIP